MEELERARQEKTALYQRLKQVRGQLLSESDPVRRRQQKERVRILREMYEQSCETVRRLDPAVPKSAPARKVAAQVEMAAACGAVWADLEGVTWSALGDTLPTTARQMKRVQELVGDAVKTCSPLQREYLHDYYEQGLTLEEIGQRHGTEKSTVSRTLKRGRGRIENYITAKLLLGKCVDRRGRFDYPLFLASARVLTERQREMVYLLLARDTSYRDIARYVGRSPSTVTRSIDRAEEKLAALNVTVDAGWSAITVERSDWSKRSEKALAEELGLSPAFYYRILRRGERVGGIPLLYCAILHRTGEAKAVAADLGCSRELVKRVRREYGHLPRGEFREDYHPKAVPTAKVPENPFATLSGEAVMDRIDADTYRRLQERFGHEKRSAEGS